MDLHTFLSSNGLTLSNLAIKCGYSPGTIGNVMRGSTPPTQRFIRAIGLATDEQVTPSELRREIEENKSGCEHRVYSRKVR